MKNDKYNIILIIGVAIGVKLLYILFAFILANNGVDFEYNSAYKINDTTKTNYINIFFKNDAGWYENIATNGHKKIPASHLRPCPENSWQQSPYAFFPLYPATVNGLQQITGLKYKPAAFILALFFSLSLFCLFYYFIKLFSGSKNIALAATLTIMLFPFSFYFSMGMTESLFLLLLILTFIGVHKNNIWLMGISAFLLVLVRPNGIIMSVPLGLYFLEKNVFAGRWRWFVKSDIKKIIPAFALLSMPVSFFGYCLYLQYMTGDFFAFSTAQAGWGKEWTNPLKVMIGKGFRGDDWRYNIEILFTLLAMGISIAGRKLIPFSFQVLIWLGLMLPLWAGTTISMPRYISLLFPIFIILGYYLVNKVHAKPIVYGLLTILQLISFYFWIISDPLSY